MSKDAAVLLLAGELSGDAYGAALARELRERAPGLKLLGTGGPRMKEAGVRLLAGLEDLAVMGFAEVVPRLGYFWRLERRIRSLLDAGPVKLVVPIDFPGLNMRVAAAARRAGIPVLYYVAPQVWAWRPGRARTLARVADRVAVILPFEAGFLEQYGVRASWVGHPLLDLEPEVPPHRASFCMQWGLDPERTLLALLPGSRRQEIDRHLGLLAAAARCVQVVRPDVLPVIARAPSLPAPLFEDGGLPVVADAGGLLRHSRAALIKSGTATLQAALAKTPTVVTYRTSRLTWAVARRLLRVSHIALPNLIVGEPSVPERVQTEATPERLCADLLPLLADGPERARQLEGFARVRVALGPPGATGRVADIAIQLLNGAR